MAHLAPINKKDKQAGIIGAAILLILLLLMMLFTSMKQADPPYPAKEVVMIMDFTDAGGGSAGGSEQISDEISQNAKMVFWDGFCNFVPILVPRAGSGAALLYILTF